MYSESDSSCSVTSLNEASYYLSLTSGTGETYSFGPTSTRSLWLFVREDFIRFWRLYLMFPIVVSWALDTKTVYCWTVNAILRQYGTSRNSTLERIDLMIGCFDPKSTYQSPSGFIGHQLNAGFTQIALRLQTALAESLDRNEFFRYLKMRFFLVQSLTNTK